MPEIRWALERSGIARDGERTSRRSIGAARGSQAHAHAGRDLEPGGERPRDGEGARLRSRSDGGGIRKPPRSLAPDARRARERELERYAVLFAVTGAQVTVGDPTTGEVSVWPRERFAAIWTGSVVQLTPMDEERRAVAARLVELRDRLRQALLVVGWGPPYRRKIAMLVGWAVVLGVAAEAPASGPLGGAWTWLLAAACAGSLWSWLASDSCGSCSYAHRLAGGLPVAPAGTALYALLLASAFAPVPQIATSLAIGAAVGAHGALVAELAKAKVACWACLFVAACAVAAAAVAILGGSPIGALLGAAALVCAAAVAVLPRAQARQARAWRSTAERLARDAIAEPRAERPTRLVAFTRKGCPACAFFHAAIKPALMATFSDTIAIDERELGKANAVAPILVVLRSAADRLRRAPSRRLVRARAGDDEAGGRRRRRSRPGDGRIRLVADRFRT